MRRRSRIGMGAMVLPWALLWSALPALGQQGPKPKGAAKLFSSVNAVVPGQPFDIAIQFTLTPGWHIYWQNSGESGLPPGFTWTLPEGFSAGTPVFPVPKRHRDSIGITTNILKGKPVLLIPITPPKVIEQSSITLSAKVRYLICAGSCIREETEVRLELPVLPLGGKSEAANEDLFIQARKALPKKESKYLSVTARTEPKNLAPGKKFELLIEVDIKRGFHIQSNKPLNPAFIACDVFLERIPDVFYEEPVYPAPKFRTIKYVGKVAEFAGRITVRIGGEVDGEAANAPRRLGGIFKYQACNQKGTCFPPGAVAFSLNTSQQVGAAIDASKSDTEAALVGSSEPAVPPTETEGRSSTGEGLQAFLAGLGLPGLLFGCFVYGLFINATPCVLPLLSIKVLGFVQQAHESRRRTLVLGLAFGVGVVLFFIVLGFLAAAGKNVLQYPVAIITLGAVVTALALSMLGVYTLQVPTTATKLEASIQKEGVLSSFGKGALAPVLGFACTGPLLAGAFGWATQQPPRVAIFAFLFAGLGMASPYILLGANPNWLSFLPRPGNWMITFERIMGFLLLAMVIWLLHPLVAHLGPEGLEWTMAFLVAVSLACWVLGRVDMNMSIRVRWQYRGGAVAVVAGAGLLIYGWAFPLSEAKPLTHGSSATDGWSSGIPWRSWSVEAVEEATASGKTVFVDFTAAYCTNCKINKAVAINTTEARTKMEALGVVPFQADFTTGDPAIFAFLQKYQRAGVPLDLIYPAGKPADPMVMPTLFSLQQFIAKLEAAGPSRVNVDIAATATAPPGT